jgi:threonylcarbamoyladenosine tRNA methylthiotransferase MtaB
VEDLPFSDLHVFPYSSRPGTRAAGMPAQVAANVIKERAGRLREVAAAKKRAFLEKAQGVELRVLVQGYDAKTGLCRGLSRNYITVEFAGGEAMINRELPVRTCGMGSGTDLVGVLVK